MLGSGLTIFLVVLGVSVFSVCFVLAAIRVGKRYDNE